MRFGTGRVGLAGLHYRRPERTRHAGDVYVGVQLVYLHVVAVAVYGAFGGEYAHMAALRERAYHLCRGSDYAEHAPRGVPFGQVALLYRAQGLG